MADIGNRFDPELRRSIKRRSKASAAVLPIGSIEQHGPHLPVSTDSDIVTAVSERVAERHGYLLLPTVVFGVSFEHAPFFNLSVRGSTLRAVVGDLCVSLLGNGIRTVFVINGHHGNQRPLRNIAARVEKATMNKMRAFSFSYWHFMDRDFDHAGFVETSLMLAVSRNVRMEKAEKGLITDGMPESEVRRIGRAASRSFPEATGNGIWGDPTGATKRDGQRILDQIVSNLGRECQARLAGRRS